MELDRIANIATAMVEDIDSIHALSLYKYLENGKMLRSKLVLSIIDTDEAYRLCAIIELIQSASLLHDDVIDSSDLRRGKPSLNAQFGNKNAIMLGDILYSRAFFELSYFPSEIAQALSQSVVHLSVGELEDVLLEESFNADEEKYLKMIGHKSASLIAASTQCAALLSNNDSHKLYYDYGFNLGMAFQIIDDILDITQDSLKLGKPALSDYKTGKTTLPYIYLYHSLPKDKQIWLKSLFKQDISKEAKEELQAALLQNPLQQARQKALEYGNEALNIAQKLNNQKLCDIISSMIERDF